MSFPPKENFLDETLKRDYLLLCCSHLAHACVWASLIPTFSKVILRCQSVVKFAESTKLYVSTQDPRGSPQILLTIQSSLDLTNILAIVGWVYSRCVIHSGLILSKARHSIQLFVVCYNSRSISYITVFCYYAGFTACSCTIVM